MDTIECDPISYFNRWLINPIETEGNFTVITVMNALNDHAVAQDETANDYFIPSERYREKPGRFRILGENQDNWYCFVYSGAEVESNPAVYFETYLDLKKDYGYEDRDILNGDHVKVCDRFTDFLWHMMGQQICIRLEGTALYKESVNGVLFDSDYEKIKLDNAFVNPIGNEFPAGYTCYISSEIIWIPDWGAAFLNPSARERFINMYNPKISKEWTT